MADQRAAEEKGADAGETAARPAAPRGRARVRPTAGPVADIQTTTGVPARPIPVGDEQADDDGAASRTGDAAGDDAATAGPIDDAEATATAADTPADDDGKTAATAGEDPAAEGGSADAEAGAAGDTSAAASPAGEATAAEATVTGRTAEAIDDDVAAERDPAADDDTPAAEVTVPGSGREANTAADAGSEAQAAADAGADSDPEADDTADADADVQAGTATADSEAETDDAEATAEEVTASRSEPAADAGPGPGPGEKTVVLRPDTRTGGVGEQTVVLRPSAADDTVVMARVGAADDTAVIPAVRPGTDPETPAGFRTPVVPGPVATTPARPERLTAAEPAPERRRFPRRERRRAPRGGPWDLGHAPLVLLLSSLGVLLVAVAYQGGRTVAPWATAAYWVGQVVVFTPVVLRLLSRRMAGVAESFLLVMGLAINQYLLKWMYSPDQFRFPDELQHWLATTIIQESGRLFQPNDALPPAVHFPGLAEMGAAVGSMTGLPVTAAGTLVAGVAHLVFVGILFVAVLRTSNSPAVAGVACATYATALHYLFFSSMFLYQTAALPFFMLAIWANQRWREGGGRSFAVVAVVSIGGTTVSHHVTAFALIATLTLIGLSEVCTARPRRWEALTMAGTAFLVVSAWILLVATDVIAYLEAPIDQVAATVSRLLTSGADESTAAPKVSLVQLGLQGAGLLGLFVLYLAVARDMVTRRDRDSWRWAALVGGAIFFAGNGVRFLGQNGPEIAGRLSTFTYVPISIVAAISLVRAVQILPSRDPDGRRWWVQPALNVPPPTGRHLVLRVVAGSVMVTVLMIGARAGGWPPLGSLLPGPYLAGGFERSVDRYGVDAADWQRTVLGPGHRVGGDVTAVSLASTYGRQDPVREVGSLYYATTWGLAQDQAVTALHLNYLVVDQRLSAQLPASQAYFQDDPMAGRITEPLSAVQLGKFDTLTEVDRLYDNGAVRIYRMGAR